jgi:hypothetical protein
MFPAEEVVRENQFKSLHSDLVQPSPVDWILIDASSFVLFRISLPRPRKAYFLSILATLESPGMFNINR